MSRIEETLRHLKSQQEIALITYLTAGDPTLSETERYASTLVNAGADILELGIPFSDPIADGPVIQEASVRALRAGTTPKKVLECAGRIKAQHDVPIVLLAYYNTIFQLGIDRFLEEASVQGVDGVVVPDMPVDESEEFRAAARKNQIDSILLATPTTSRLRLRNIVDKAAGFLYLVSVTGVTGERDGVADETLRMVQAVCQDVDDRLPVAVGFGISKPDHVRRLAKSGASGAIIGSALVRIVAQETKVTERLTEFTRNLKTAAKAD